jgi:hypothetical protein
MVDKMLRYQQLIHGLLTIKQRCVDLEMGEFEDWWEKCRTASLIPTSLSLVTLPHSYE